MSAFVLKIRMIALGLIKVPESFNLFIIGVTLGCITEKMLSPSPYAII
jgi:hypothetical protein